MFKHPYLLEAAADYRRWEAVRSAEKYRLIKEARMVKRDQRDNRHSNVKPFNQIATETASRAWPRYLRLTWFMAKFGWLSA